MLVSEILATVRPAYCDTWPQVFEYFETDAHERRRVEELMGELRAGTLEEPGRIDRYEPDPEDPEDQEEYLYLGNGTHRFAAAVKLGLEDFPVTFEAVVEDTSVFYEMTEVELWIKKEYLSQGRFEDAFMDCFSSSLSFRVTEDAWAEMGGCSSTTIGVGRSYSLSFYKLPDSALAAFPRKLLERISCCVTPEMIDYLSVAQTTHYEPKFWESPAGE